MLLSEGHHFRGGTPDGDHVQDGGVKDPSQCRLDGDENDVILVLTKRTGAFRGEDPLHYELVVVDQEGCAGHVGVGTPHQFPHDGRTDDADLAAGAVVGFGKHLSVAHGGVIDIHVGSGGAHDRGVGIVAPQFDLARCSCHRRDR